MVEKLKLPRIPHNNPFKFSWLNGGQCVLVKEQSLLEFIIGGYKDRILCYILPMDVYHLLLGRHWQFDIYALYDARKNTYEIEKDGISFTLTPLKEMIKRQTKTANVMMVGRKEFIRVEEEENMEVATTSNLGEFMIVGMKNGLILEGNDVELKVKDELVVKIQEWLKKHVDMMMKSVFFSLLSREVDGHCISMKSKVDTHGNVADIGAEYQKEEMER